MPIRGRTREDIQRSVNNEEQKKRRSVCAPSGNAPSEMGRKECQPEDVTEGMIQSLGKQ